MFLSPKEEDSAFRGKSSRGSSSDDVPMAKHCKAILYHQPETRSSRVFWFLAELEEAGVSLDENFEIKYFDIAKKGKSPEYLYENPLGTLPLYYDSDTAKMVESGAIVMYLARKWESQLNLIPKEKSKYYQWIMFAVSTLDDLVVRLLIQTVYTPKEKQDTALISSLNEQLLGKLTFLNSQMKYEYCCGNSFSAADIVLGWTIALAEKLGLLTNFANLTQYCHRLAKRTGFVRAYAAEESKDVKALKVQLQQLKIENRDLSGKKNENIMTLYHHPGTGTGRILWLLYELGLQQDVDFNVYDLRDHGWKFIQSKEYKALNPNQTVGALVDGKRHIWENGAIIQYIIHKYKGHLLYPKEWTVENWNRNNLYEYWCLTTLDGKFGTNVLGQTKIPAYLGNALKTWWLEKGEALIVKDLGDNKYIQGNEFTMTDIYLGHTLIFLAHNGVLGKSNKMVQKYYQNILKRKAFVRAQLGNIYKFE